MSQPNDATAVRILSDADLRSLNLTERQIANAVSDAIRDWAAGRIWTAPKSSIAPGPGRYMMSTLSASDDPPVSIVKVVTVSPENPGAGKPAINGTILLHDSRTGELCAVMDAAWITAVRTAGLSAAVARKRADPASRSLALIGTGVQGHSHLEMFADLFPLAEVRIFGRGQKNIDLLASRVRDLGLHARIVHDPQQAIHGADLIVSSVTALTLDRPFLDAGWVKPGAFVSSVDLGAPWRPETLNAFGHVIIDDPDLEAQTAKKMIDPALVTGDLKSVVGDATGQHDRSASTAFVFRGLAVGDFAVAALVWRAVQGGIATNTAAGP